MAKQTVRFSVSIGDKVRDRLAPKSGEVIALGIFDDGSVQALVEGQEKGDHFKEWIACSRLVEA